MQKHCIKSSSDIYFGYLLEWPQRGDSNKYPKHMFCEAIRIKQGLSFIVFCPLRILYNSIFIIMATFLGTNAVVVTGIHCTKSFVTGFGLLQCYVLSNTFLLQTFKVFPLYRNTFLLPFYPVAKRR